MTAEEADSLIHGRVAPPVEKPAGLRQQQDDSPSTFIPHVTPRPLHQWTEKLIDKSRRSLRLKKWSVAIAVSLACAVWQVWFWNDGADSNSSLPMILFASTAGIAAAVLTLVLLKLFDKSR